MQSVAITSARGDAGRRGRNQEKPPHIPEPTGSHGESCSTGEDSSGWRRPPPLPGLQQCPLCPTKPLFSESLHSSACKVRGHSLFVSPIYNGLPAAVKMGIDCTPEQVAGPEAARLLHRMFLQNPVKGREEGQNRFPYNSRHSAQDPPASIRQVKALKHGYGDVLDGEGTHQTV